MNDFEGSVYLLTIDGRKESERALPLVFQLVPFEDILCLCLRSYSQSPINLK